ncbi:MAG: 3-hydroxyacyl-CoA dehydrogenase family protein [Bacteroidota bacterium]
MTLLIIGNERSLHECKAKLGTAVNYQHLTRHDPGAQLPAIDVVIDFLLADTPEAISFYRNQIFRAVFVNSVTKALHHLIPANLANTTLFVGLNGMPTFINRPVWEVALLKKEDEVKLAEVGKQLQIEFALVQDQAGMVTARVIAMIINEAYLTLEEGTASREDIDKAMKLGTNYPYGPFEWAERIGLNYVCEILAAVQARETQARFPISALLKQQAMQR